MFGVRPRPNGRCNDEPVMVLRCKVVGWSETWGKWWNGRVFCFWLGWVKTTIKTSSSFWATSFFILLKPFMSMASYGGRSWVARPWVSGGGGGGGIVGEVKVKGLPYLYLLLGFGWVVLSKHPLIQSFFKFIFLTFSLNIFRHPLRSLGQILNKWILSAYSTSVFWPGPSISSINDCNRSPFPWLLYQLVYGKV